MKKLLVLTLIASPAFAHSVPFDEPEYLAISSDPAKAHAVKVFYEGKRLGVTGCKDAFAGKGNFAVEAATKCEIEAVRHQLQGLRINQKDIEQRAHQVFGDVWHKNIIDGHAHGYSAGVRRTSANSSFNRRLNEISMENDKLKGTKSKISGTEGSGGFDAGIPGAFTVNFNFGGSESTAITASNISPEQIKDLSLAWLEGWNKPYIFGFGADVVTDKDGKVLASGSSSGPAPEKTESEVKTTKKKEEKKGAENPPPHHEEDTLHDIPGLDSTSGGERMAGDSGHDVSGIATPVMDESLAPKSGVERCVEKETKRLLDEVGQKTIDPNRANIEDERKKKAASLLKTGYCQESYYGREFCTKANFKTDSVVAIDIKAIREEAAIGAMEAFKNTGICNPNALGKDFCKKAHDKFLINPMLKDPMSSGWKPRTIKPGDLPSIRIP